MSRSCSLLPLRSRSNSGNCCTGSCRVFGTEIVFTVLRQKESEAVGLTNAHLQRCLTTSANVPGSPTSRDYCTFSRCSKIVHSKGVLLIPGRYTTCNDPAACNENTRKCLHTLYM